MRGQDFGTPFNATGTGTTSALATQAAETGKKHFITDISVGTDAQGQTIQIRDSGTVIWALWMAGTSNSVFSRSFSTPIGGSLGSAVSLYVGTSTAVAYANISGYTL